MTENTTGDKNSDRQKKTKANKLGFIVFALLSFGVMVGCKTCSESASDDDSVLNMNVCPATGTGGETDARLPEGHVKMPKGHPQVKPAQQPSLENVPHIKGKVVETMNAARYTYVLVDDGKQQVWGAAPEFQVKVDDEVIVPTSMPMKDFKSGSLDRTFEVIYFTGRIEVVK